ncbi:MAG: hypothetical protein COB02_12795 [Candidatus Cloacimonadota bacterium]|nr:MAG: hypothetical protein COB02_12795 [Candidatus Cloacimonadota bacterium]
MFWIKEISFKIFFIISALFVYLLVSFINYKIDEYTIQSVKVKSFLKVLSERDAIQTPLVGHNDLPSYKQKNEAIESIFQVYIKTLETKLIKFYSKNKKKGIKQLIKSINVPFGENCSVYVAINKKFKFLIGKDLSNRFGKKWESKFFLAYKQYSKINGPLKNAVPISKSKLKTSRQQLNDKYVQQFMDINIKILTFPTTYESFERYVNKVTVVYNFKKNKSIYHYFVKIKIPRKGKSDYPFYFYIFLDADEAKNTRINKEVSLMLIRSNKNESLTLSKDKGKDLFYIGNNLVYSKYRSNNDGLTWIEQYPSFSDFLYLQKSLNLVYVILTVICLILGDFRFFNRRYEIKLLLLILLVLFFIHVIINLFFNENTQNLEDSLKIKFKQKNIVYLKSLENKFNDYMRFIEKEISIDFHSKKPLSSNIYGNFISALYLQVKDSANRSKLERINLIKRKVESDILCSFLPRLMVLHKEYVEHNDISSMDKRVEKIEIIYSDELEKEKDLMTYNSKSLDRLMMRYKSLYSKDVAGKFIRLSIVKQGYYLLWNKMGEGDSFKFMSVGVPGYKLFSVFFDKELLQKKGIKNYLLYAQDHKEEHLGDKEIKKKLFDSLLNKHKNSIGKVFDVDIENIKYWGVLLNNVSFPSINFLFLSKKENEILLLNKFSKTYIPAHIIIFSLTILLALLLCYSLMRPMTAMLLGFSKIEEEDFDYKIKIISNDENAVVSKGFNNMIEQMNERQQMMPFISGAVGHLFKKMEDNQAVIKGNAVVLFADIRSFTTISETYTPEEVVSMLNGYFSLYQPLADKYDGIIERFIGDAVSMVFLEDMNKNYIENAVIMAKEVMLAIDKFNEERLSVGEWTIKNGIGMSHGYVYFSLVGNEEKTEFFILGDSPEIAEELEAESKRGKNSLIITDNFIQEHCKKTTTFIEFESLVYPDKKFYEIVQDGYEIKEF